MTAAAPQLPPRMRRDRPPALWVLFIVGLVVAAPIWLALGLVALGLAIILGALWLVWWALVELGAWTWFVVQRSGGHAYPFRLRRPPVEGAARSLAVNDAFFQTLPRSIGLSARLAAFLLSPLALGTSILGVFSRRWRARPYLAVFSLTALERKLIGLGERRGYFDDGHDAVVVGYDEFLREVFPVRAEFLDWWREGARGAFIPTLPNGRDPVEFAGLALDPYPDPLGYPGLALTAMRRTEIRGLRDLMISQREIDDLGDPDLDDRPEAAVIRVAHRASAAGVRQWIVQLPSTQSWSPRTGAAPNDLTAAILALSGREATLTRAALEVVRRVGIRSGDRVMLAGFSLGGMIAAQLAQRCGELGATVTHLVTAGAPIGRDRIPAGVHVLSLEHRLDSVPRLDGRENPVRLAGGDPHWVTVKAGPPLPHGYRIAVTHFAPSYVETAGEIEDAPPSRHVAAYLEDAAEFFGPDQQVRDFAATRAGFRLAQAAVPVAVRRAADVGVTRETLRLTLRRVPGVVAVDLYRSRSGFPTNVLWSADVLVDSLRPWFAQVERDAVYRGLLSLLDRRQSVGITLRLRACRTPGVMWQSTLQRTDDGRWRETVDVAFDSEAAEAEYLPVLLPAGWSSRITYFPADAFTPLLS